MDPSSLKLGKDVMRQLGINPGFPDNVTSHHTNKTRDTDDSTKGDVNGRTDTPKVKGEGIKKMTNIADLGLVSQLDFFVTADADKTDNYIKQNTKGAISNATDAQNIAVAVALVLFLYVITR